MARSIVTRANRRRAENHHEVSIFRDCRYVYRPNW